MPKILQASITLMLLMNVDADVRKLGARHHRAIHIRPWMKTLIVPKPSTNMYEASKANVITFLRNGEERFFERGEACNS